MGLQWHVLSATSEEAATPARLGWMAAMHVERSRVRPYRSSRRHQPRSRPAILLAQTPTRGAAAGGQHVAVNVEFLAAALGQLVHHLRIG